MSLLIHVDACSGHKANERPRQFVLDEEVYESPLWLISGTSLQRRIQSAEHGWKDVPIYFDFFDGFG